MKIQIQQQKLIEILDYLYVDGLFPFSIIQTKDGKLFSIQMDKEGYAYRHAIFLKEYFHTITEKREAVKIDIERIKKFANIRKPEEVITIEYPVEKKLVIKSGRAVNRMAVASINQSDIKDKLPFIMKGEHKNIPYINDGQVALDTHVSISLATFKELTVYGVAQETEFYRFKIGADRKLSVLIGDVHAIEDSSECFPNAKVFNVNEELDVTFAKGIPELAKTISSDVDIHFRSNMPAWFAEISQRHKFGVLLTPVKEQ